MRMHRQVLDVGTVTLEPYRAIERRLAAEGITIATLAHELDRDSLCWARFAALHEKTAHGWVDPDPRPVPEPAWSADELRRRHRGAARHFWLGDGGAFLACHHDRYVGFSGALGIGVDPAYRGRGIATALKVRMVLAAIAHNCRYLIAAPPCLIAPRNGSSGPSSCCLMVLPIVLGAHTSHPCRPSRRQRGARATVATTIAVAATVIR